MKLALLPAVAILAAAPSQAQHVNALVRYQDALFGPLAGHAVWSINGGSMNQIGGWSCTVTATDGVSFVDVALGSPGGAPLEVLAYETSVGGLDQFFWEGAGRVSNSGACVYSAFCNLTTNFTDTIWIDQVPFAVQRDPVPGQPGRFWTTLNGPSVLDDGTPVFLAGFSSTSGGPTVEHALVRGADILLRSGDLVPGMPVALSSTDQALRSPAVIAPNGAHFLVEVDLEGPDSVDAALVHSGQALLVGGALVREDALIAAPWALQGERWRAFDGLAVNGSGSWLVAAETNAPPGQDEVLVRDGALELRIGDAMGNSFLTHEIQGVVLNSPGDYAVHWSVWEAGEKEVVVFNGEILVQEGDAVDLDGDGALDAGTYLQNLRHGTLSLSDGGVLTLAIDVDVNGTIGVGSDDVAAFVRIDTNALGGTYCASALNSTGFAAFAWAEGSVSAAANDLVLRAEQLPPGQSALFYFGPAQILAPFGHGLRCVGAGGGLVYRLPITTSNGLGEVGVPVNSFIPPAHHLTAGSSWNFQCWYRDPTAGGAAFNLTNALALTFEP